MSEAASIRTVVTHAETSGAISIDAASGNYHRVTLAGNATFGLRNVKPGHSIFVEVQQNAIGGWAVLFTGGPQTVQAPDSGVPNATPTGLTVFQFQGNSATMGSVVLVGASAGATPATGATVNWFVSFLTGNDANDGLTPVTALKTPAEWTRRTLGAVISVPLVTVLFIDLDLVTPPPILVGYSIIPAGSVLVLQGRITNTFSGIVGAWRAENAATNTARAITTAGAPWAANVGARAFCLAKGLRFTVEFDEGAGVGRVSAPYSNVIGNPSLPGVQTDLVATDAYTFVALPRARDLEFIAGTIEGEDTITFANVTVVDLAFAGVIVAPTYDGGGGILWVGCQFTELEPKTFMTYTACRSDTTTLISPGGFFQGHTFFSFYFQTGGTANLADCYFHGCGIVIENGLAHVFGPCAFFDLTIFLPGFAALHVTGAGVVEITGAGRVYGSNNDIGAQLEGGSSVSYELAGKPTVAATSQVLMDSIVTTWAAGVPRIDFGSGSSIVQAFGGLGAVLAFAEITTDQVLAGTGAFVTLLTVVITNTVAGFADCEFQASVFTLVGGATFRITLNGTPVRGCGTAIVGGPTTVGVRTKVALPVGANTFRVSWLAAIGVTLDIRPVTQISESASLTVRPTLL